MLSNSFFQHLRPLASIVLLEARRTRLPEIALLVALAGMGLTQFIAQIALTESDLIRFTVLAALYRLAAVFILASFVVASVQREFADQGIQLALSLPITRASFCAGKLAGFAACAVLLALLFGLMLWLSPHVGAGIPWASLGCWAASLAAELMLVAALATFCAFSLSSTTGAIAAITGFYLLSRSVGALQLIAASPVNKDNQLWQTPLDYVVDAIGLLLPRLDAFTETAWLTGTAPGAGELAIVFGQAALYVVLLAAALMFDFYRREL
jgi:ABC-type transport system involved in multi-copper enzyme maturation permease subunit